MSVDGRRLGEAEDIELVSSRVPGQSGEADTACLEQNSRSIGEPDVVGLVQNEPRDGVPMVTAGPTAYQTLSLRHRQISYFGADVRHVRPLKITDSAGPPYFKDLGFSAGG